LSPPQLIAGRYRIEERLGAGGMSTVFRATDSVLERAVAVKLLAEHLAEDVDFVARFRREALSAARLQHPNVVQVFDSGRDTDSQRHYIVMEYVDGPSCADLLREHKQLDIEWTVHLLRDACHGLDYAHRAGVVHRDVKPGNLLVARETNTTKLADFGIAKAAEQTRITQVGAVLGTAAYLSPEQARGEEAGPASDIYSLGVCAYQFLTGRLPHEYSSLTELALKQQESAVQPITELRPDVPPELDDAVRLCLERDPENRYGSALELGRALEAGLRGESTQATRRLILSETDATRALAATDVTSSTRAMPRTSHAAPAPTAEPAYSPTTAPPARRDRRDAQRAGRRRQTGSLFALALVLAAVAAVAIALLASSGGNKNNVQAPDANDVQQQINELRDFIGEHSR
jgi:eukaryotic-like serine/threonine-protein kinase